MSCTWGCWGSSHATICGYGQLYTSSLNAKATILETVPKEIGDYALDVNRLEKLIGEISSGIDTLIQVNIESTAIKAKASKGLCGLTIHKIFFIAMFIFTVIQISSNVTIAIIAAIISATNINCNPVWAAWTTLALNIISGVTAGTGTVSALLYQYRNQRIDNNALLKNNNIVLAEANKLLKLSRELIKLDQETDDSSKDQLFRVCKKNIDALSPTVKKSLKPQNLLLKLAEKHESLMGGKVSTLLKSINDLSNRLTQKKEKPDENRNKKRKSLEVFEKTIHDFNIELTTLGWKGAHEPLQNILYLDDFINPLDGSRTKNE